MLVLFSTIKGGVGKTTLSALLLLASMERFGADKVAPVDFDANQLGLTMVLDWKKNKYPGIEMLPADIGAVKEAAKSRLVVADMPPVVDRLLPLYAIADRIVAPDDFSRLGSVGVQRIFELAKQLKVDTKKIRVIANMWNGSELSRRSLEYVQRTYNINPPKLPELRMLEKNLQEDDADLMRGLSSPQAAQISAVVQYILGDVQ